jgi:hypothetical protein
MGLEGQPDIFSNEKGAIKRAIGQKGDEFLASTWPPNHALTQSFRIVPNPQ